MSLRRAHHLQARRDRLLLAGRQDEGSRLRRAWCMGTIIRETIGVIADGAQDRLQPDVHRHHARATRTSFPSSAARP